MESIDYGHPRISHEVQKDMLSIFEQQSLFDFQCKYDHNEKRFEVSDLGMNRIANLIGLCKLLAHNSIRIVSFDCIGKSIRPHALYSRA
jgi:hypothetical protein